MVDYINKKQLFEAEMKVLNLIKTKAEHRHASYIFSALNNILNEMEIDNNGLH